MYNINQKRIISTFVELARISSPSWQEDEVIEYIILKLDKLKIKYKKYKCGKSFNLLIKLKGDKSKPSVLFSAHTDTVTPCKNVKPIIGKKIIKSDGKTILGADDKAAIAMFLEALEIIQENSMLHGPIEVLLSCAEEIGLKGIKGFDIKKLDSKLAFIFDNTGNVGKIIYKAPYHSIIGIAITGKAAHAGLSPEKGISAIKVISEIITQLPQGRIDEETTANTGIVFGGRALNIVPENANCKIEVRSISNRKRLTIESEISNIVKNISKKYKVKYKIDKELEYPGFAVSKNNIVSKTVVSALKNIGITPEFEISGGGSDTNILSKSDIDAINLSCGMQNVHSTEEFIEIKDLIDGTKLVLSIIETVYRDDLRKKGKN